jgi:hypothetical protein
MDILKSTKMIKLGLKSLVINSDTYSDAQQNGRDLWDEVREGFTMVLLSPEELASRGFFKLLEDARFSDHISSLGVDEVHLIYWWGKSLRPAFRRLGNVRARLPLKNGQRVPVLGITATLHVGEPMECVQQVLGLVPGQYRFIRRSNVRHDIQIIFHELRSGITGHSFPELDWILEEGDNTVIFCKTIALDFRVACYLWYKAAHLPNREKRIRLYNSLNWPTYNSETLGFLNNNQESSITIATDTLSVGWDSQFTRNAVLIGEPNDIDEFVQKIGRIGRDRDAVPHPRAFLYYTRTAITTAKQVVDGGRFRSAQSGDKVSKSGDSAMDISMAKVLLAKCKTNAIEEPYENPAVDPACICHTCQVRPPISRRERCNCSGCEPEEPDLSVEEQRPRGSRAAIPCPPRAETMTKELRIHGTRRLENLRWQIFENADEQRYGFLPPHAFLPDDLIKTILDHFHLIKDTSDVKRHTGHNPLLSNSQFHILEFCQSLQVEFDRLRQEKKLRSKAGTSSMPSIEDEEPQNEGEISDMDIESDDDPGTDSDEVPSLQVVSEVFVPTNTDESLYEGGANILEVEECHQANHQGSIRWRIDFR